MLRAVAFDGFPPFGKFRIDFPPVENRPSDLAEVHLLTGVNGTGKTRLLSVLAAMLGNDQPLMKRLKGSTGWSNFAATDNARINQGSWACMRALPTLKEWVSSNALSTWCQQVPAFAYHGAAYVSDASIAVMAGVPKPNRQTCLSFFRSEKHSSALLQAIANLKVQAAMDSLDGGNGHSTPRTTSIVQALEKTLSEITKLPFLFNVTTYPEPSLRVRWGSSELPFDLLPDGLRSIIGWMVDAVVMMDAWMQGKGNPMETESVFLLDEVESHLHPVWQRRVLPTFQRLFPKAQIFVATHSPFVISSLNVGWIHRLALQEDGTVTAQTPVPASAGDSYNSVLEEIMGLDEWYDPETEKLLADFRAERDRAYRGDSNAKTQALELAEKIGARSTELHYTMGRELSQMERHLSKSGGK